MKKYPQYNLNEFVYIRQYKPGYNMQFDLYNSDSSKTLSFAYFPDSTTYLKSIYFFSYQERDVYKDSCVVRGFIISRIHLYQGVMLFLLEESTIIYLNTNVFHYQRRRYNFIISIRIQL